jgi:hypothetical protein
MNLHVSRTSNIKISFFGCIEQLGFTWWDKNLFLDENFS